MNVPFAKVQSVGNDFVLVETSLLELPEAEIPAFSKAVCERRFGVGSDGLLLVEPRGNFLSMRMFNPDGTEDFCGNGLRCAAIYARSKGWFGPEFPIEHFGRSVHASADEPLSVEGRLRGLATTVLPGATFDPIEVPLAEGAGEHLMGLIEIDETEVVGSAVSTGSTHTIIFVDELPKSPEFERISEKLEHHPLFPQRTSVIWTVVEQEHRLRIRIWERGVGETLGCGTGSSAAVAVHLRRSGGGGQVEVENPGGTVSVEMADWRSPIQISSEAEIVYEGSFDYRPMAA